MSKLHDLIEAGDKQAFLDAVAALPGDDTKAVNEVEGQNQDTVLHRAVQAGWHDVIPALVAAGADLAKKDFYEADALFTAVDLNQYDAARALLEAGAKPDTRKFMTGITALQLAIETQNLKMVELLLDAGADIAQRTPQGNGRNAFHYAATSSRDIMDVLLKHPGAADVVSDIADIDKKKQSALRIALEHGDRALVEKLIRYGVDVNEMDDNGETPLYYVIAHRKSREDALPLIRLLLESGADVAKAKNYWDETPLFPAVSTGFAEAVRLLLDLGLDAAQQSHLQQTPLHLAAEKWNANIINMLAANGADVNATDRWNRTPLHIAAKSNRLDVVKALLDLGADPFLKDKDRKTPRDYALAPYQQNVASLLSQKEAELEIRQYGYDIYQKKKKADAAAAKSENENKRDTGYSRYSPQRGGRFQNKHSSHRFGNRR